jgi:DNA-binding CsgD family transcriptional regulator
MGGDASACRGFVTAEATRLVNAELGLLALDPAFVAGGMGPLTQLTIAGSEPAALAIVAVLVRSGRTYNPVLEALLRGRPCPADGETVCRRDLVSDTDWYGSSHVIRDLRPAGFDDLLVSVRPTTLRGTTSWIAMLRRWGVAPFAAAERDFLHLLHEELERLDLHGRSRYGHEPLPPRVQEALTCLLTGAPDKQIAEELGVSLHTAREYVKRILKTFGASNRSQLIASLAARRATGSRTWHSDTRASPPTPSRRGFVRPE